MKYQYHSFLENAARSFLDRHYPEDFSDDPETFNKAVKELVEHLDAKLWDEWPGIRDELQRKQDHADAGHPGEEQLMSAAEARGDPAREPSDARSGA